METYITQCIALRSIVTYILLTDFVIELSLYFYFSDHELSQSQHG